MMVTITRGQFSFLNWSSVNATSVTVTPEPGVVTTSGRVPVAPVLCRLTHARRDAGRLQPRHGLVRILGGRPL